VDRDQILVGHRVNLLEGGHMYTDAFNKTTDELIEAKASAGREFVRTALGQVLDYSRYVRHSARPVLLPIGRTRISSTF
jgi:hypothetical protein